MLEASASPAAFFLWLLAALLAHVLVSLFAVLCRYLTVSRAVPFEQRRHCGQSATRPLTAAALLLQIRPSPPLPALRLALIVNLIALASLLGFTAAARTADWLLRRWQQRRRPQDEQQAPAPAAAQPHAKQPASEEQQGSGAAPAAALPATRSDLLSRQETLYGRRFGAPQRQVPEIYLRRGLSGRLHGWQAERPGLARAGALALLSGSFAVGCTCQVVAAGWVDASISEWSWDFVVCRAA